MKIDQYFEQLEHSLHRLSPAERQEALNFYREYAGEAGIGDYEAMERHFGSPKELASAIYADAARKQVSRESGGGGLWRGFAIGLAALVTLPLSFPLAVLALALCMALAALLFSFFVSSLALFGTGFFLLVRSFAFLIPFEAALWFKCLGGGLMLASLGAGLFCLLVLLVRKLLTAVTLKISGFVKRRTKNEA